MDPTAYHIQLAVSSTKDPGCPMCFYLLVDIERDCEVVYSSLCNSTVLNTEWIVKNCTVEQNSAFFSEISILPATIKLKEEILITFILSYFILDNTVFLNTFAALITFKGDLVVIILKYRNRFQVGHRHSYLSAVVKNYCN